MTKFPEIFEALAEAFAEGELKQHPYHKFWYATARTVANRLDQVLGPENWWGEPLPWNDVSVKYSLTIQLPDGSTVTKYAVGAKSTLFVSGKSEGKVDPGEADKGGDSDGFKRAAAMFSVGRYLYNEGTPDFGKQQAPARAEKPKDAPRPAIRLLNWAKKEGHLERAEVLAEGSYKSSIEGLSDEQAKAIYKILTSMGAVANIPQPEAKPAPHSPGHNGNGNPKKFGWPTSGVAFFAWCKALGGSFKTDIVGSVKNGFAGQPKNFGGNFLTWTPAQVQEAAIYVASLVSQFPGYTGEFDAKLPKTLQDWREEIWQAASKLVEAMGNSPTTEAIELHLQSVSQSLASQFGGEVLEDLEKCQNVAMLTAILEAIQGDLKDATATY